MQTLIKKLGTANPNWPDDLKAEHARVLEIIKAFDAYDKDTKAVRANIGKAVESFKKGVSELELFCAILEKKDSDLKTRLKLDTSEWVSAKKNIFYGQNVPSNFTHYSLTDVIDFCKGYSKSRVAKGNTAGDLTDSLDCFFCEEFEEKLNAWERSQKKDK